MFRRFWHRFRAHFRKGKLEREMDAEMRFHLEMEAAKNIRRGMSEKEARLAALRNFGGVAQMKEAYRDFSRFRWLEDIWQDLHYGGRTLFKNPSFSLIAILMVALGIGANTAIFSIVNAALLRPLPFKQPEQLVMVYSRTNRDSRNPVAYPDLLDWRAQSHSFAYLAVMTPQSVNLTGRAEPGRVLGGFVSADFFKMLGVEPVHGRTFLPGEDEEGAERVAVVNHKIWRDRFGADINLIGQTLTLNGQLFTVVGVMPDGFHFPYADIDVWMPIQQHPYFISDRKTGQVDVIGRLKSGVTQRQALTEMETIAARLARQFPETNRDRGMTLVNFQALVVERVRPLLLVLFCAVGFVLLIACANVANLMLSRAVGRSREFALRSALGARRSRLVRQLLTESLLLSLSSGIAGTLIGIWGMEALAANSAINLPFGVEVKLDRVVLGFTLGMSVLTGLVFGLFPALRFSRPNLNEVLKEGGRTAGAALGRCLLRNALVITQIALSLILLAGAGLMIRSFVNYLRVDPGFDPKNVLTMEYRIPRNRYPEPEQQRQFHQQVVARVKVLPGIESAALIMSVPHGTGISETEFVLPGQAPLPENQVPRAQTNYTDSHYFSTLRIPLLKGRVFNDQDRSDTASVIVINQAMAQRFWPNENPIGKQVHLRRPNVTASVAGVVGNVKHYSLDEPEVPQIYLSYVQYPDIFASLVVRTIGDAMHFSNAVRGAIWSIDKDQPVWKVRTLESLLDRSLSSRRFMMQLLSVFSVVAVMLAAGGIYAAMSYTVSQRTNEIGIRVALGAQGADVLRLVIGQGMKLILIGVAIGLLVGVGITRVMSNLLFGVSATDPLTFTAIVALLTLVGLLACWIPAQRAVKVDPMIALRHE